MSARSDRGTATMTPVEATLLRVRTVLWGLLLLAIFLGALGFGWGLVVAGFKWALKLVGP
jgi:hypothetical protein